MTGIGRIEVGIIREFLTSSTRRRQQGDRFAPSGGQTNVSVQKALLGVVSKTIRNDLVFHCLQEMWIQNGLEAVSFRGTKAAAGQLT